MTVEVSQGAALFTRPRVSETSRIFAALAYLLLIVGWLLVVLLRRGDSFAMFHAQQSLRLSLSLIVFPVLWLILAWLVALIPLVGAVLVAASFALIVALIITAVIAWIFGLLHAVRGEYKTIPFFG